MIQAEHITKQLHHFRLEDITFTLPAGYMLGLVGENGAGKTSLLQILAGLYSYEGELVIPEARGVVFHDEPFDAGRTLFSNGKRYGCLYPNFDQEVLHRDMERFHLNGKKRYGQLSKGEKLKFQLAFALAIQPEVLLLDEPSANFDREFREEFHKVLREFIADGEHSIVLSSHITEDLERSADYLLLLHKGRQLLFDDIETIRETYRMVGGETYKVKLLKDRIIHMEERELGCTALVEHWKEPYDAALRVWKPSIEELMYHMLK